MLTRPLITLRRLTRRLWVRVALMACLSVLALATAVLMEALLPSGLAKRFSADAVMPVLTILASSMLAVSTFSLNIMVSAHRTAAGQATPRVHRILMEDTTTQTVLATFLGAFVYALSAIILFQADLYRTGAPLVVMAFTILVVILVILAMLRWIDHLSDLGSMDATLQATEERARSSLARLNASPYLGAQPMTDDTVVPTKTSAIPAPRSGYVQMIDVEGLNACTPSDASFIYVKRMPGQLALQGLPLARVSGQITAEQLDHMTKCFVIGDSRTFEQDPAFGLLVLSEISSRALSPGVNDPSTAIEAISRMERLLWDWSRRQTDENPARCKQVFIPATRASALIEAAFAATARDGAGSIEVAQHLQNTLKALQFCDRPDIADAASEIARHAMDHAEKALTLDHEKSRLRQTFEAPF